MTDTWRKRENTHLILEYRTFTHMIRSVHGVFGYPTPSSPFLTPANGLEVFSLLEQGYFIAQSIFRCSPGFFVHKQGSFSLAIFSPPLFPFFATPPLSSAVFAAFFALVQGPSPAQNGHNKRTPISQIL